MVNGFLTIEKVVTPLDKDEGDLQYLPIFGEPEV